jgi:hypothetical protein
VVLPTIVVSSIEKIRAVLQGVHLPPDQAELTSTAGSQPAHHEINSGWGETPPAQHHLRLRLGHDMAEMSGHTCTGIPASAALRMQSQVPRESGAGNAKQMSAPNSTASLRRPA